MSNPELEAIKKERDEAVAKAELLNGMLRPLVEQARQYMPRTNKTLIVAKDYYKCP